MNVTCESRPATAADDGPLLECALCGMRFLPAGTVCSVCPLSTGCELARCPNCGYQFPRASRVLDWLRRRFFRGRPRA